MRRTTKERIKKARPYALTAVISGGVAPLLIKWAAKQAGVSSSGAVWVGGITTLCIMVGICSLVALCQAVTPQTNARRVVKRHIPLRWE